MPKRTGIKKHSTQAKSYVKQKEADKMVWTLKVLAYTQQEMLDAVALTLSEFYGFGPDRQKQFHDNFEKKYTEIRKIERDDSIDKEYFTEKIEQALKVAFGKYYEPREVRYDMQYVDPEGNVRKL